MATRKVVREVEIVECDFCGTEDKNCSRCALCGKYACTKDRSREHIAFAVDVYDYRTGNRIGDAHVCKQCAKTKPDLTIGEILGKILGKEKIVGQLLS